MSLPGACLKPPLVQRKVLDQLEKTFRITKPATRSRHQAMSLSATSTFLLNTSRAHSLETRSQKLHRGHFSSQEKPPQEKPPQAFSLGSLGKCSEQRKKRIQTRPGACPRTSPTPYMWSPATYPWSRSILVPYLGLGLGAGG